MSLDADSAIVFGPVCGAATDTSAVVAYKLDKSNVACRLVLSESPELTDSTLSPAVESSAERGNAVKIPLFGLKPETDYYYGLELNGVLQSAGRGRFTSFPSQPDSFTFAFGNSLKYSSAASGLAAALENEISFFLCTGDFFYENISVRKINRFRAAYQKAFKTPALGKMGKTVPFVFIWDDHDYGANNSDKTAPGRTESRRAYREIIHHYPLAAGDGDAPIHQAFSFGKVRKSQGSAVLVRSQGNGMVKIKGMKASLPPVDLRIYDIRGKLVKTISKQSVTSNGVVLSLAPGFYTLQAVRAGGKEIVKFMVE